jgi:hypothetical protein
MRGMDMHPRKPFFFFFGFVLGVREGGVWFQILFSFGLFSIGNLQNIIDNL